MGKFNAIAVIYGSDSSEWEVSCRSGEFVASRIDGTEYDIYQIFARFGKWQLVAMKKRNAMRVTFPEGARPEIDKTDFSVLLYGKKVRFDYAYIVQHGAPGENGLLQGYLEMLGIPFSSCSAFTSAVAFDKYSCKAYIRDLGAAQCALDVLIHKDDDIDAACAAVCEKLQFPVFVKPTSGGSSFGISRVETGDELKTAVLLAFREDHTVLVEQGVSGRELTCAAWKSADGVQALPVIEIIPEGKWFDYDAKYNGHSREVCPAEIPDALRDEVQRATCRIYSHLGCAGIVRIDYIAAPDGLWFLEVNTIPGMTSASLVPKMIKAAGLDITDFLTRIIEGA